MPRPDTEVRNEVRSKGLGMKFEWNRCEVGVGCELDAQLCVMLDVKGRVRFHRG